MKLLFVGDIFTESDHDIRFDTDHVFGNLEGPLGGNTVSPARRTRDGKRTPLQSNPEFIRKLNMSAISVANNHIWDYGKEGFEITKRYLNDWGWKWSGIEKEISDPIVTQDGNIFMFSYSWHIWPMTTSLHFDGEGPIDIERNRIKKALATSPPGIKIVSLHWGFQNEILPMPSQRRLGQNIIDWGADIVMGTHPHVIQGIEQYKNGLIMYSLGNFIFKWKDHVNPFPHESIGVCVDTNHMSRYDIVVFNGDEKAIRKRIDVYSKYLSSNDYDHIWKNKRKRKELPGISGGYDYKDTFDDF